MKHIKTQFLFESDTAQYIVVCKSAKREENVFDFYKEGAYIGSRQPRGGHVNKTSAETQLKLFLKEKHLKP